jgi:hypothetical protein
MQHIGRELAMTIKTIAAMLLLLTVLTTGSLQALPAKYCISALEACLTWCQTYFAGDTIFDGAFRNGCRTGCIGGFAECAILA